MNTVRHELGRLPPVTRFFLLGTFAVTVSRACGLSLLTRAGAGAAVPRLSRALRLALGLGPIPAADLANRHRFFDRPERIELPVPSVRPIPVRRLLDCSANRRRYFKQLETVFFQSRTADATWGVGILCALIFAITRPLGAAVLSKPFLFAIMHLWAQTTSGRVSLFGFIDIPAVYLPFAMMLIEAVRTTVRAHLIGTAPGGA